MQPFLFCFFWGGGRGGGATSKLFMDIWEFFFYFRVILMIFILLLCKKSYKKVSLLPTLNKLPKRQQSFTWGTVSARYKCNSKLQAALGGTVETTGTETSFCITKMPYEETFWHSRALNCEAISLIQLKFELHWDFMPVLDEASLKNIWLKMNIIFFYHSRRENVSI